MTAMTISRLACVALLVSTLACRERGLLQTGQTTCFEDSGATALCTTTGQDGETQTGWNLKYKDNGDGTISDLASELMWEKLDHSGTIHDDRTLYTWEEAFAKVAVLNAFRFAGHGDWRLPNLRELHSLVHFGKANPAIDDVFHFSCGTGACTTSTCSCTSNEEYWTSTTNFDGPSVAWHVFFGDGHIQDDQKTRAQHVRAVRGSNSFWLDAFDRDDE